MNQRASYPSFFALLVILLSCLFNFNKASAQDGYLRPLHSFDYQSVADMQVTANGEMRIAATNFVYGLNSRGEIALQQEVREGTYSEIRAAVPMPDGSEAVLLHVLDGQTLERLVFYRITQAGILTGRREVSVNDTYDLVRLKKISNDRLLVSYKKRVNDDEAIVWGICINMSGQILWEKSLTGFLYNNYSLLEQNEGLELMYRKKGEEGASLVRISPFGTLQMMDFYFSYGITAADHFNQFVKLADGTYLLGGGRLYATGKNEDIVLVKTNEAGRETSIKRMDIQMADILHHMYATSDGVLLLASSGRLTWGDMSRGEILIIKTDHEGNEMWRRAYGSPQADMGYFIKENDNHVYITGRMFAGGGSSSIPVAMQVDSLGYLADNFAFLLAEYDNINDWNTGVDHPMQSLAGAVAGGDNNVILGLNYLNPDNDLWYARVAALHTNGRLDWSLNLPQRPGEIKVLSRIRPNDNLVITETRDIFSNVYDVTQFNDQGQTGWTYQTGASHMSTAIRTTDGGYLLIGDVDISYINYDVQLIKLNAQGGEVWTKRIGVRGKWELPRCVIETPERDFIIAGTSVKEFDVVSNVYVLRINQDGQVLWQKEFETPVSDENAFSIVRTADNNYLLGGFNNTAPFNNRNAMLLTFTGDGRLINKNNMDIHEQDEIQTMLPLANGGFVVAGNTSSYQMGSWQQRGFIMQLNENAATVKTTYYGPSSHHLSFQQLVVTSNNDTLLVGTRQPFYGYSRPFFLKVQTGYTVPPPPPPFTDLYIYPNPSSSGSRLKWVSPYEGPLKIQVFNSKGQQCFSTIEYKSAGAYQYELPRLSDASGLYFVRMEIGTVVRTLKWMRK